MNVLDKHVGITAGTFDLLHAGHVLMLQDAKKECGKLVVALHVNPNSERSEKNKPLQTLPERYFQLKCCRFVDEIIPYETEEELLDVLMLVQPNVRIIGSDYIGLDFTGKQFCQDNNIEIIYNNRNHRYSSSELRDRMEHC